MQSQRDQWFVSAFECLCAVVMNVPSLDCLLNKRRVSEMSYLTFVFPAFVF